MIAQQKLPEKSEGPWVTGFDPITLQWRYTIDYTVSYAEDSPFFHALGRGKLLGSECKKCNYRYATPRTVCMICGRTTEWFELPIEGRVHSWTVCHFSGEPYLAECPFALALVEFDNVDTLFMTRLVGVSQPCIGMPVRARFRRKKTWSVNDVYFVNANIG
jgi:uncharacterized OB-fold protein